MGNSYVFHAPVVASVTWSSPRFIPVVLISGLIFSKTHNGPSLALKRFLSHVIAWDTTCIYQQFNTQQFLSLFLYSGYFYNLCVMCGSADLFDKWARSRLAS